MEFPQSLLNDPNVVAMSRSKGQTPHEYLSLILNNNPTALAPPAAPALAVQDNQGTYPTYTNDNRISGDMNPMIAAINNQVEAGNAQSQAVLNGPADRAMAATAATEDGRPIGQGGVLQNNGGMGTVGFQDPTQSPALSAGGQGATSGALTSGGNTAAAPRPNAGPTSGARQTPTNNTGNSRRSGMPDMRIGRMAQLGRMGTAMLGSAGDGLLASMSAGGDAMYAVNDENRAAEMGEYENSERLRLEEAQRRAVAARGGSGGGSGGSSPNLAGAAAIKLRDVDAALQGLDDYDGVVGMGYWFNVGWDKITDSQRATIRQKIARVKVDATLSNTADTKGAISDKEMAIFQSDQPAWTDGENAWRTWLTEYRGALMIMHSNLSTGTYPYLEQGAASGQTTAPAFNASDYTVVEITE
mgnify:CR=1 FL=1